MSSLHNVRTSAWFRLELASPLVWSAAVLGVGVLACLVAASLSWVRPFVPRIHDEFSNLLLADTLLHGRLSNPTPEVWQPFQSFHVILQPSYASKYPLGPGGLIALGWLLFGAPIGGAWLGAGFGASSCVWMLRGVVSKRWALLGGTLVALHPVMQSTWSQSLLNGWLPATAAAILTGGVLRLRRRYSSGAALALGLGVAMLALSRPFEGLVATCSMAGLLGTWWWRRRPAEVFGFLKKTMVVSLCPVIPALAAMAAHNWATTGSWHRMPYQLHEHQYGIAPLFVWGTPKEYNANTLADQSSTIVSYHTGWSLDSYTARAGILGWLQGIAIASLLLLKYWGVMLGLLPILTCLFWLRFELARWLCVALMFQIIASSSVCWIFTHYLAPVMPWLVVLSIVGLRQAGVWLNSLDVIRQFQLSLGNKQPPLGNASVLRLWGVAGGCALLAQFIVLVFLATKLNDKPGREWAIERALIEERLQAESGEHLVMVHYAPGHNVHEEWVYNWADLERSKVLWARGERADWNGALFAKYKEHRKIWSLNIAADGGKPVLLAISEPNSW